MSREPWLRELRDYVTMVMMDEHERFSAGIVTVWCNMP